MAVLGLLFGLVVLGETLARDESPLEAILQGIGWVIWTVFVADFVLRFAHSASSSAFLRRNWWQLVFLVLPFLRFLAVIRAVRAARAARIVSSAIRGSRGAGAALGNRIAWLVMLHFIVVLSVSQLLFELGGIRPYSRALHLTALASVSGEPLGVENAFAQGTDVVLATYAVVVFASLAGVVGAYFVERRTPAGVGASGSS